VDIWIMVGKVDKHIRLQPRRFVVAGDHKCAGFQESMLVSLLQCLASLT